MNNSVNPQVDNQEPPPSYSSQTGDGNYPQGYSQYPAAYPPQQGHTDKWAYPSQGYPQGGGYTNYPQPQYYPPPASSNNNQTIIVTQDKNVVVQEFNDYICSAVFAMFMFLPTGIVALIKANEAQTQYQMGNIQSAHACNNSARRCIKISIALGVLLIILVIGIPFVLVYAVSDSVNHTYSNTIGGTLNREDFTWN